MATARRNNTAMVLGVVRRNRRSLMTGTALQATVMLVLALPAQAQPAPNARPVGGTVVGGSATISRTTSNTQIDQASQRAAIDWRNFDIGSRQRVTFNQPAASAVVLNRVTGPDPSQIAGRIDANGQFILVNQSGVNFYKGAQVNAAGVMVSAANITNQNFMAGVMKFDKAGNPNAKIDNQGTITVQQAGLAALVAPQVANSGTISAKLGHVVLAGAKTATLDLFGDGLLSLDVSNQVMQAPVGKDGKAATALVTNTGVIIADGGTVQLTARAADGIVQNLVQAGGTISAATMGDQTGVVALNGVGGSIVVEGQLSAPGSAPGTKGGAIEMASNGNVLVGPTARIDASGKAGGGVVAIGTTLARAKNPNASPTLVASQTAIQNGATISVDAATKGAGGRVAVLSSKATAMAGMVTAKGGAEGGDGGFVEVSANAGFSLTGAVDAGAPLGKSGTLRLDPRDLIITTAADPTISPGDTVPSISFNQLGTLTDAFLFPSTLAGLTVSEIQLQTTRDLLVNSNIALNTVNPNGTTKSLTLLAGRNVTVGAGVAISVSGSLRLEAASTTIPGADPTGAFSLGNGASLNAPKGVTISSGTGGVQIAGSIDAGTGNALISSAGNIAQIGPAQPPQGLAGELGELHIRGAEVSLTAGGDINQTGYAVIFGDTKTTLLAGRDIIQSGPTSPASPLLNGAGAMLGSVVFAANNLSVTAARNVTQSGYARMSTQVAGAVTVRATSGDVIQSDRAQIFGNTTKVSSGADLSQSGSALIAFVSGAATGNVEVDAGRDIAQTGPAAVIEGNSTAVSAGGNIGLAQSARILAFKGGTTVTAGGGIAVSDNALVQGASIALKSGAGGITMTGNSKLDGSNSIDITSAGPVTEAPTSIIATGSLTSKGGVNGSVNLLGTGNTIDTLGGFVVTGGDLNVVNGTSLALVGNLTANNLFIEAVTVGDAPTASLVLGTPAVPGETFVPGVPALLTATGTKGRVTLVADQYVVGNGGSAINTTAGTVELAPASPINTSLLGTERLVIGADLLPIIHTNGGTLEVGAFTDVPAGATAPAPRSSSVNIAGALNLNNATAATLRLDSTGPITQTGGRLTVASLTGSAGTFADLTQPANQIDKLGAFSTTAGFALVNNKPLLVAGPVTDTGGASTLALTTRTGDITLAGNVSATNVVNLISAGAINQTGGSLAAGTLTGSAATFASLTQPANLISTLGAFSTTAGFALVNNKALLVAGPVHDTGGASTLALTTMAGDIALAGNVSATNVVDLNSAGAINQTGGSLAARTLTGSAGSSAGATLTSDNAISFFGPFTATSGVIDLVNSVPLTINGALTARLIFITATGSISLAGDITTGGLASFTTVPTDPLASLGGAFFIVLPDAGGNSSFAANSNVASLDGTGTVMFVSMPPQGGNVGLTNLNAPGTELLLNLGSGNASGQVNVGSLFVLGAGGQVNFTNSTVQGFTGSVAALAAQSFPPANPAYLVNGCEIGVGCLPITPQPQPQPQPQPERQPPARPQPQLTIVPGVLAQGVSVSSGISNIAASLIEDAGVAPIQSTQETNPRGVPILNPMRDLSGGPLRDRQSDPDLLLPNVSEKDY